MTLSAIYIFFGNWVYMVLGNSGMTHIFITEELDQNSLIVKTVMAVFCLSLVCSYAICIFPANLIVEDYLYY